MKLTKKKLDNLVEEVLVELTGTQSSTGGTADLASALEKAREDLRVHREQEPTPKAVPTNQAQRYQNISWGDRSSIARTASHLTYWKSEVDSRATGTRSGWGSGDVFTAPSNQGRFASREVLTMPGVVRPGTSSAASKAAEFRSRIERDTTHPRLSAAKKAAAATALRDFDRATGYRQLSARDSGGPVYYEVPKFQMPGQQGSTQQFTPPPVAPGRDPDYQPRATGRNTAWGNEQTSYDTWLRSQNAVHRDPQERYKAWRTSLGAQSRADVSREAPSFAYASSGIGDDPADNPVGAARDSVQASRSRTVDVDRPAWTNWNSATAEFQQAVDDADAALRAQSQRQQDLASMTDIERGKAKTGASMGRPRPVRSKRGTRALAKSKGRRGKATGGAAMGGLKGGGFGRTSKAKGVGKKRGKGKKKDESLFRILGRDLIKEIKSQKKYNK